MNKKIIYLFFLLFLMGCSVNVDQAFERENFNPNRKYEPLSLHYNGHPVFSIGQTMASLDSIMQYQKNESGKYHHSPESITDYVCHDSNLAIWLDTGNVSGNIQFSADNDQNRIFRIIGFWMFNLPNNPENLAEAKQQFCTKFFPALNDKVVFKEDWQYIVEHPNYMEIFELQMNKKSNAWVLSYKVKLE